MHQVELAATVHSINVAEPRSIKDQDGSWTTAFFKSPVVGSRHIGELGLEGDGQADQVHHGGRDKAVLVYSADHFEFWSGEVAQNVTYGGFGENLSVSGICEADVCIGDRWRMDDVLFEVSQPRQPCWKLGRRWHRKELPKQVVQTGYTGWYCRVVESGSCEVGMQMELIERPHPDWTIAQANAVFYDPTSALRPQLAEVAALSTAWKRAILE